MNKIKKSDDNAIFSRLKSERAVYALFLELLDVVIIFLVLWATSEFFYAWDTHYMVASMFAAICFVIFANQSGLYQVRTGEGAASMLFRLFQVWGLVVMASVLLAYMTKTSALFSRFAVVTWFVSTPLFMALTRRILSALGGGARKRAQKVERAVIAGISGVGLEVARALVDRPDLGIELIGFYDETPDINARTSGELPVQLLGNFSQLVFDARAANYDTVFLTGSLQSPEHLKVLVHDLAESHVSLKYIPDIFALNLLHSRVSDVGGIPCINVYDSPLDGIGRVIKRIEDVVLSLIILPIIGVPMLVIALLTKMTSPGPVMFKQKRYGFRGEEITVWKFRTMRVCEEGDRAVQATKNDPRVTPMGAILRKTSLDELPQFLNVLMGDMSIVGPRPHPLALDDEFKTFIEGYMLRHTVKPGITGWAQVNGWRGETDSLEKMEQRVQHDLHYIRNWSVWFDLQIIVITVLKGFTDRNAY